MGILNNMTEPTDLPRRMRDVTAIDPSARALQIADRWHSWGDIAAGGEVLQTVLGSMGASVPGAGVAVVMRNGASTVAATVSIVASNQAILTLSDLVPNERLADTIRAVRAVAIVANPQDWTEATLASARDIGAAAISVEGDDPSTFAVIQEAGYAAGDLVGRLHPGVALEMMTSGTTGPPKRIPLTYASLSAALDASRHYASSAEEPLSLRKSVAVVALPMVHMGGVWTTLLNFAEGRAVAMLPKFQIDGWIELIREHRPIVANVPPAALTMLLDRETEKADLASLKALTVGTAPVSPELAERFEATYEISVLTVYGATEFAGGVAGWSLADRRKHAQTKRGSVGRSHSNVEMRVVDRDSFAPLPFGDVGLLELRSEQLAIDSADPDGWVRTDDLATVDADGFLWIKGRADDAIIRGGFKVSAGQVAETLRTHPQIRDAAVVGMPDDRLGEIPYAAVELENDADIDGNAIRGWLRDHLSAYQIPAQVLVVESLPRSASLKVDSVGVRALLAEATG
ncbi:2-succinylbenzoate--CoA ligase [Rhodococcus fascians]|nr:2-succinylbenzoate--CoA ligase [Rhodococcus fascians]